MKFLVLVICLLTNLAFAGEIKVKTFSEKEIDSMSSVTQYFEMNPELKRAWVTLSVYSGDGVSSGDSYEQRILIEGLRYNDVTSSVEIDFEGKITTCAEVKSAGRSIFRHMKMVMTPYCRFETRIRIANFDNGFEIKKIKKYDVFLIVD